MPRDFSHIVIGVGTLGAATLWRLAERGAPVLGLDRFTSPNAMSEHAGEPRMFRCSYYEHPGYVPLLRRALAAWPRLNSPGAEPCFTLTGGLYLGPRDGALITGASAAAREHGLEHRMLTRADLQSRYPIFDAPPHFVGMLERDAGLILPEEAIRRMRRKAEEAGALVHEHERVVGWTADDAGVRVETDRAAYTSQSLVLTAGPWSSDLLRGVGIDLAVTRQLQHWVSAPAMDAFTLGSFPCWAIDVGPGQLLYGFPALPGRHEMKIALHARGETVSPDDVARDGRDEDLEQLTPLLQRWLPGLVAPGLAARTTVCMYTNSADSHFIIDRVPGRPRVVFATGTSGHGFKFAPVLGELLADMTLDPHADHPAPFLSLERFARGGR